MPSLPPSPAPPRRAHDTFQGRLRATVGRTVSSLAGSTPRDPAKNNFEAFGWPTNPTLESVGEAIAHSRGMELRIQPIPTGMRHHEISGLTAVEGATAWVFYDPHLSPLNREQTIMHEFAHILHGDVRAHSDVTHLRSMFADPIEQRAELTGMELLDALHSRHAEREKRSSALQAFLSGRPSRSAS